MPRLRSTISRALAAIALGATAAACQPIADPEAAAQAHPEQPFARSSCGGCHAIDRRSVSPNPGAPPFGAIVNQAGLTRNTLAAWLRRAHNYPEQMKFTLEPREADRLADYMLTLRDPNYRPEI